MDAAATVRALFVAFSARDVEAAVAACTEDVMFWPQGTASEVGRSEPYRGHAGIRRYFADVARVWAELELEPQSTRVAGQGVIAFGRARARARDGRVLDVPIIWVIKLQDTRVASLRAVGTAAEADRVARG